MTKVRELLGRVLPVRVALGGGCTDAPEPGDGAREEPKAESPQLGHDASTAPDASVDVDASITADAGVNRRDAGEDAGVSLRPRLGVNLFPAAELGDAGLAGSGDSLLSETELLALGIEATHLMIQIDRDLDRELYETVDRFSARDVSVALSLELVSGRRLTGSGESGEWDLAAFSSQLDQLFAEPLNAEYLAIGSAVDLYWADSGAAEKAAFAEFLTQALTAARKHPAKPSQLKIGFNSRLQSWISSSVERQMLTQWTGAAEFIGISWFPVDDSGEALEQRAAIQQLDDFYEQTRNVTQPIVLQQVAYPSSPAAGSSPNRQSAFYSDFLNAIASDARSLVFVAISGLDEPPLSACARVASDFGPQDPEVFTEAWCSVGLRDRDLTPKPAYDSVIEGLARFSSR